MIHRVWSDVRSHDIATDGGRSQPDHRREDLQRADTGREELGGGCAAAGGAKPMAGKELFQRPVPAVEGAGLGSPKAITAMAQKLTLVP